MFDIGFSELLVIGVVALVVIGPEKLPRVARTVGHLVGRLQRYVADVKADISREAELDELRRMRDSVQSAAQEIESAVNVGAGKFSADFASAQEELHRELSGAPPADAATTANVGQSAAAPAAVAEQPAAPSAAAQPHTTAEPLASSGAAVSAATHKSATEPHPV